MACDTNCNQVIDFYGSSDSSSPLNAVGEYIGQAFRMGGTSRKVCCATFSLSSNVSSNITVNARLYACSGTPGSGASITGSPLATSESRVFTGSTIQLEHFGFSTPYTLNASTNYCIVIWCTSFSAGAVNVRYDITAPTHAGNMVNNIGQSNTYDSIFYIYYNTWTGTINSITNPAKVNSVTAENIYTINGI